MIVQRDVGSAYWKSPKDLEDEELCKVATEDSSAITRRLAAFELYFRYDAGEDSPKS